MMDTAVTTYLLTSLLRRGLGQRSERHLHSKIAAIFFSIYCSSEAESTRGDDGFFLFSI